MKTTRSAVLFLAILGLALLAGCGNKGDLVKPSPTTVTPAGQ